MEYFICYLVYGQFANPGNGQMDGWKNRWTNDISSRWTDGLINGCNVYGKIDGHLNNGQIIDKWTYRLINEWMDV